MKSDGSCGADGSKDGVAYQALLRNEVLGVNMDDNGPALPGDDRRMHYRATPSLYSVSGSILVP